MPTFDASGLDDLPRAALRDLLATVGEFVVVGKVAIDVVPAAWRDSHPIG